MRSSTQWVEDIVCNTQLEFHGLLFMISVVDAAALRIRPPTTKIKTGGMAKFQRPQSATSLVSRLKYVPLLLIGQNLCNCRWECSSVIMPSCHLLFENGQLPQKAKKQTVGKEKEKYQLSRQVAVLQTPLFWKQ